MEARGSGDARDYDQKIRTVKTHVDGRRREDRGHHVRRAWVDVPETYDAMRNDLGMAVEHKPAGKYDSEAERVAQPAGFAYMAPPGQASNQYGYWDHRDGRDFWVFYGQYALMRDLLFNHDYRPLDRCEWEGYRSYQSRGQTYYGHDSASGQKYGTHGAPTQQRYSGSSYAQSGGFKDSQYAAKRGGFGGSKYASPSGGGALRCSAGHGPGPEFRRRPCAVSIPAPAPRTFHMPSGGRPPFRYAISHDLSSSPV